MPNPSPEQSDLEGALPQFGPDPDPPPPPEEPTPRQTSAPPPLPPPAPGTSGQQTSSQGSSEGGISLDDLTDAIGDLAGGVFAAAGQWLNSREIRRRRRMTERWLPTQDEIQAIGELAERYLTKQIPDSVAKSEELTAVAVGGLVVAGYAIRNLLPAEPPPQAPQAPPQRPQAPPPAPAPPAPAPPAPAPPHGPPPGRAGDASTTGIQRAEPAPLDVIAPGL